MDDERALLRRMADKLTLLRKPCQLCKVRPATAGEVHFRGNVGMFVARQEHELKAMLCTRCLHKQFLRFTVMNVLFGWWGLVSIMLTPGFILKNIAQYEFALRAAYKYRKQLSKDVDDTIAKAGGRK